MPEPTIPNNINVTSWFDLVTDPGTAVLVGFGMLILPFIVAGIYPAAADTIKACYTQYALGITGLVGAHAWKDADKTRYLLNQPKE